MKDWRDDIQQKIKRSSTIMNSIDERASALPKNIKNNLLTKSPSGGTITFDEYCYQKKLYRNVQQSTAMTVRSNKRMNQALVENFP